MVRLNARFCAGKRWLAINAVPLCRRVAAWIGRGVRWIAIRWTRGQAWLDARRRERIRALLAAQATVDPAGLLATGTRVDVGSWFGAGRVWMVWTGETLALAAAGKRPLALCLDRAALKDSVYNPVTGELLLRPAHGAVVRNLKIDPLTARRLLDAAGHRRKEHYYA